MNSLQQLSSISKLLASRNHQNSDVYAPTSTHFATCRTVHRQTFSVWRVSCTLQQSLFAYKKAKPELLFIGVAFDHGVKLLAAERADDLPFVVCVEDAFVSVTGNFHALFTI